MFVRMLVNSISTSATGTADTHELLCIGDRTIARNANRLFSTADLLGIVLKQAFYENWLKVSRSLSFRSSDNKAACAAYEQMSVNEFEGINARQAWANWRTVPRNLSNTLERKAVRAIDLCCGIGNSTEVLAYYLPPGSDILGLEHSAKFVKMAAAKTYYHENGYLVRARFNAQSVLETFREPDGTAIGTGSIDLVNCCGAVGHHFIPAQTRALAAEIARVLRRGGLTLIDSGRDGTPRSDVLAIFAELGFEHVRGARSCFIDPYEQLCFRKS